MNLTLVSPLQKPNEFAQAWGMTDNVIWDVYLVASEVVNDAGEVCRPSGGRSYILQGRDESGFESRHWNLYKLSIHSF